jgi:hypothetical protein
MSKDQWIAQHDRAREDYASKEIDLECFITEMKELGFDQGEIKLEVIELDLDRNCN